MKWLLGAVCKEAEAFRRTLEGHSISPSAARLAVLVGSPLRSFSPRGFVLQGKAFLNRLKMTFPPVLEAQSQ